MCKSHCKHTIRTDDELFEQFPVEIKVNMVRTPGPIWKGGQVQTKYNHKFIMTITDEYPYQKPVVQWGSIIFHPNIMMPQDGGNVCSLLLDNWGFSSNLLAFIRGIESLLLFPNPKSPFGTDSCTKAAQYFHHHTYDPKLLDEC